MPAPRKVPLQVDLEDVGKLYAKFSSTTDNAMTSVTNSLDSMSRVLQSTMGQLEGALAENVRLSRRVCELEQKDLEREKYAAEQDRQARKDVLEYQRSGRMLDLLAELGRAVLPGVMLSMGGSVPHLGAGVVATAEGDAEAGLSLARQLADQLGIVLKALQPETRERIQAEAGLEAIQRLYQLVMAARAQDSGEEPRREQG